LPLRCTRPERYFHFFKDACVIIRRYLGTQVLATSFAVAGLLTVILMSSRVIQFFEKAANGKIAVDLLTAVLWYRLPGFLELILPLGLFIGLLLALGRLYLDNEMAVLAAAGIGPGNVIRWLLPATLLVTALTALMALWWSPSGVAESDRIYAEQANRSTFELIQPGRFQRVGERMLYADMSPDKSTLRSVILLETQPAGTKAAADGERQIIIRAREGRRVKDPVLGADTVELLDGERWLLRAGAADYQRVAFERYRLRLKQAEVPVSDNNLAALSTPALWQIRNDSPKASAEWGWRISLVFMVPIIALLALPLAKVNPRQGRYLKLLPAIVLYLSYVVLLAAVKSGIEKESLSLSANLGVHVIYLLLALVMLHGKPRRSVTGTTAGSTP